MPTRHDCMTLDARRALAPRAPTRGLREDVTARLERHTWRHMRYARRIKGLGGGCDVVTMCRVFASHACARAYAYTRAHHEGVPSQRHNVTNVRCINEISNLGCDGMCDNVTLPFRSPGLERKAFKYQGFRL